MAQPPTMTVRLKRTWYGYVAVYGNKELFRIYWWSPLFIQSIVKEIFGRK